MAGATGYTGRALVEELCARGVKTVAHVRADSPRLEEWRARFQGDGATVDSTPWDEDALTAALAEHRPQLMFALLGTTRARARRDGDTYEQVDYGLTTLLLRALLRGAPAAHFVYLSSIGVGPRARGAYLGVRWRIEQELRDSGVAWTIVRPSFITGADREDGRPAERVAAMVMDAVLHFAGLLGMRRLRDRYRSLTAAQLARALAHHALDPDSAGRVLHAEELRV